MTRDQVCILQKEDVRVNILLSFWLFLVINEAYRRSYDPDHAAVGARGYEVRIIGISLLFNPLSPGGLFMVQIMAMTSLIPVF